MVHSFLGCTNLTICFSSWLQTWPTSHFDMFNDHFFPMDPTNDVVLAKHVSNGMQKNSHSSHSHTYDSPDTLAQRGKKEGGGNTPFFKRSTWNPTKTYKNTRIGRGTAWGPLPRSWPFRRRKCWGQIYKSTRAKSCLRVVTWHSIKRDWDINHTTKTPPTMSWMIRYSSSICLATRDSVSINILKIYHRSLYSIAMCQQVNAFYASHECISPGRESGDARGPCGRVPWTLNSDAGHALQWPLPHQFSPRKRGSKNVLQKHGQKGTMHLLREKNRLQVLQVHSFDAQFVHVTDCSIF